MIEAYKNINGFIIVAVVSACCKRKRCLVEFPEKSIFWFGIGEQINGMHNA